MLTVSDSPSCCVTLLVMAPRSDAPIAPPQDSSNSPLLWEESEVAVLLTGSPTQAEARKRTAELKQQWQALSEGALAKDSTKFSPGTLQQDIVVGWRGAVGVPPEGVWGGWHSGERDVQRSAQTGRGSVGLPGLVTGRVRAHDVAGTGMLHARPRVMKPEKQELCRYLGVVDSPPSGGCVLRVRALAVRSVRVHGAYVLPSSAPGQPYSPGTQALDRSVAVVGGVLGLLWGQQVVGLWVNLSHYIVWTCFIIS